MAGFAGVRLRTLPQCNALGRAAVVVLVCWQLVSSSARSPRLVAIPTGCWWIVTWTGDRVLCAWRTCCTRERLIHSQWRIGGAPIRIATTHRRGDNSSRDQPAIGWIAISELRLKTGERKPPYRDYAWLEAYEPLDIVGKSIRLYYIPGDTGAPEKVGLPETRGNSPAANGRLRFHGWLRSASMSSRSFKIYVADSCEVDQGS
jgi:hypothetical protein